MATDTIPALQNLVYRVPSWDVRDILCWSFIGLASLVPAFLLIRNACRRMGAARSARSST